MYLFVDVDGDFSKHFFDIFVSILLVLMMLVVLQLYRNLIWEMAVMCPILADGRCQQ